MTNKADLIQRGWEILDTCPPDYSAIVKLVEDAMELGAQETLANRETSDHQQEPKEPLKMRDLLENSWRPAITREGKRLNGAGVKVGLAIARKTPFFDHLTDEQWFQKTYGPAYWKEEK